MNNTEIVSNKEIMNGSLGVIDIVDARENTIRVREMSRASLHFSRVEVCQILKGAEHFHTTVLSKKQDVPREVFNTFVRLNNQILDFCPTKKDVRLEVSRTELKTMKMFLELRMSHCEQVRQNELNDIQSEEKFNPDAYICQKLLLISIREALLGQIIE